MTKHVQSHAVTSYHFWNFKSRHTSVHRHCRPPAQLLVLYCYDKPNYILSSQTKVTSYQVIFSMEHHVGSDWREEFKQLLALRDKTVSFCHVMLILVHRITPYSCAPTNNTSYWCCAMRQQSHLLVALSMVYLIKNSSNCLWTFRVTLKRWPVHLVTSYSCGHSVRVYSRVNVWLRRARRRVLFCPWVEFITPQYFLEPFGELLAKTPVNDGIYTAIEEIHHLCVAK